MITYTTSALKEDVEEGRAETIGQSIQKQHIIRSVGVFFDQVARTDPADPSSPKVGLGRFHAELWVLSWFGIDFSSFKKSQLVATRFFFDALFPFVLLFSISFVTRPVSKRLLDQFFAKLHTPVQKTEEDERKALEESYAHPRKYEKDKIKPGSNWEIMRPRKLEILGFGGIWVLVGLIILLLWVMVSIK